MARYPVTRYGMTTPYEVMPPGMPSPDTPVRDATRATADEDGGPVTVEPGASAGVGSDHNTMVRLVARRRTLLEATVAETLSEEAMSVLAGDIPGT